MFLAHTYFNVVSVCSFLWQILYKGYLIPTLVYSRIHMCVEIMVASVKYHSDDATKFSFNHKMSSLINKSYTSYFFICVQSKRNKLQITRASWWRTNWGKPLWCSSSLKYIKESDYLIAYKRSLLNANTRVPHTLHVVVSKIIYLL